MTDAATDLAALAQRIEGMGPEQREALWIDLREGGLDDFREPWVLALRGYETRREARRLLLVLACLARDFGVPAEERLFLGLAEQTLPLGLTRTPVA